MSLKRSTNPFLLFASYQFGYEKKSPVLVRVPLDPRLYCISHGIDAVSPQVGLVHSEASVGKHARGIVQILKYWVIHTPGSSIYFVFAGYGNHPARVLLRGRRR